MKQILITGLDGSGKSTILNFIAKSNANSKQSVLYLPHIDTLGLDNDTSLKKTAEFINALGREADLIRNPQLKAVAIFTSMLLYRNLIENKKKQGASKVYCERHPLIDTGIYAQFYAEKMGEKKIDHDLLARIDNTYGDEIHYLIHLIPSNLFKQKIKNSQALASFITQWFFIEGRLAVEELKKIFLLDLPDKIYYLKASPEILVQRLSGRLVHEAHESENVLRKLSAAYDSLFEELKNAHPAMVEVIDANIVGSLNDLQKKLTSLK